MRVRLQSQVQSALASPPATTGSAAALALAVALTDSLWAARAKTSFYTSSNRASVRSQV